MQVDQEVDTRGLNCPLPILKAKKALAAMQSGQLLKVVATDTGSIRDFQGTSMKSEFAADLEGRSQGVFQAAPERCSGCVQPQRLENSR